MKKYALVLILAFLTIQLRAQNFYGKRISIDNGLSQSSVTAITYDNNGSLWIGTRYGLNEYRNGKVKAYTGNNENGIGGSYINGLLCDNNDRLWVATDRGVFLYKSEEDNFSTISTTPANCLFEAEGQLYIGGNYGVIRYNESDGSITDGETEVWTDIMMLHGFKDSILCIDKRNGISIIGKDGNTRQLDIPEIVGKTIMAASILRSRMILSILGEGVLIYDLDAERTESYIRLGERGLSRDLILSSQVIDGRIWLGTDGNGIMILDPDTKSASSFNEDISLNPGATVPKSVTSIYQDPIGNIWIGGVYSGVTGLKPTSIKTFVPEEIINTLYLSDDGYLYIGSDGSGISRMTINDAEPEQIRSTIGMKITSISDYDARRILLCAYNQGFFLMDRKSGRLQPFTIIDRDTNMRECLYGNAPEACRLSNGKILIYAVHNYLHDPQDGSFKVLGDDVEGESRDLHAVSGYGHDKYAFAKTGVFRIEKDGTFVSRIHHATNETGNVNALACADGLLFYGTDYGLYSLNPDTGVSSQVQTNLFTRVTELCMDSQKRLWIGADNTLFMYIDGAFELIGENRGVPANEFTSSTPGWGNSVYVGGTFGLLGISDVDKVLRDNGEKSLHLHNVSVNGKKVIASKGRIKVPHDFENLGLTVSMSGSDPLEKVMYRYSVKGLNSYTVETFEDELQLPTLNAGNYTVNVSYLMEGGRWSEPQTILYINVLRAWYASIAMRIFYILLLAGALVALALYVRKKMMEDLQAKMRSRDTQFISKFEQYIDEHLGENSLDVEQIAAALAMSRATLYSKVKSSYDIGIGEYIEGRRMAKAKELLSTTTMSVADISDAIGYSTPRYFSTRFKIVTGDSPLAYRKKQNS